MIKLLLDNQIFASSEARFCRGMCNDGRNTLHNPQDKNHKNRVKKQKDTRYSDQFPAFLIIN